VGKLLGKQPLGKLQMRWGGDNSRFNLDLRKIIYEDRR
jgi:hypothetical protein